MVRKPTISPGKKYFFSFMVGLIPFIVFVMIYFSYTIYRTMNFYQDTKTKRGWIGKVHVADVDLAFVPVPDSKGTQVYVRGPDIPMRYDKDGFRAPIKSLTSSSLRPSLLALGCSFTYGDFVYATDTYTFLAGQSLKGTGKNAGVCGYGLAQMLPLARKLVPAHKPDYLLVQYSPWLVDRALKQFAPSRLRLPSPYFYDKNGSFEIQPPIYLTNVLDLPLSQYRNTPINFENTVSFFLNVGLPLYFHEDLCFVRSTIARFFGKIPEPTDSRDALIQFVYSKIDTIAKQNNAKLLIIVLNDRATPVDVNRKLFPLDAIIVEAHNELLSRLSIQNEVNYSRAYAHWEGSPPRILNIHPNKTAHRIIADLIVAAINQSDSTIKSGS